HPYSYPAISFKHTTTTETYTLSLHDALPISMGLLGWIQQGLVFMPNSRRYRHLRKPRYHSPSLRRLQLRPNSWRHVPSILSPHRSEEHTSELQSRENLVCRLLLEKKKTIYNV